MLKRSAMMFLGLFAIALVGIAGCSNPQTATPPQETVSGAPQAPASEAAKAAPELEPATINFGHVAAVAYYWDVFTAIEKGFAAEQKLTINVNKIDVVAQSVQALLTGAIDIVATSPDGVISAIDKGGQLSIIGNEVTEVPWVLMATPDIKSYADLKGQTLGVSQLKDASTLQLRMLMQKNGIQPSDFDAVQLGGTGNRFAALQKGTVKAALLAQPIDFKAQSAGMNRLGIVSEAFDGPAIIYAGHKDWLKSNGDVAVRFLKAVQKSAEWLYDPKNKDEAVQILMKAIKVDEKSAAQTYDMYLAQEKIISRDSQVPTQHLQNYLTVMLEMDLLNNKDLKVDSLIDLSFANKAAQK